MSEKIPGSSIESGTVSITQMESATWSQVYAALATANAAYAKANSSASPGTNVTGNIIFTTGKLGLGISPNTTLHVEGTTTLSEVIEKINVSANGLTANLNYDVLTQPILYLTSASTANATINFRGNSNVALDSVLRTGQSITVSLLVTNSLVAYKATTVLIDNILQIPKWAGSTEPVSGSPNSVDLYSYTIIKTGNSEFTVFASQQKYG